MQDEYETERMVGGNKNPRCPFCGLRRYIEESVRLATGLAGCLIRVLFVCVFFLGGSISPSTTAPKHLLIGTWAGRQSPANKVRVCFANSYDFVNSHKRCLKHVEQRDCCSHTMYRMNTYTSPCPVEHSCRLSVPTFFRSCWAPKSGPGSLRGGRH